MRGTLQCGVDRAEPDKGPVGSSATGAIADVLKKENQALRRIVLAQVIKDIDFDPAEAIDLLDSYRPAFSQDFERSFAPEAVLSWIATRRFP